MADQHEDDQPPNKRPKIFQGLSTNEISNLQELRDPDTHHPDELIGCCSMVQPGVMSPMPPTQGTNGVHMGQQTLNWDNTTAAMQRQIKNNHIQLIQTATPPLQHQQALPPHQPAFGSIIDPEKQIQQQCVLLLHAYKCQKIGAQPDGETWQCTQPHCKTMKEVLHHIKSCAFGKNCAVPLCSSTIHIIDHWNHCHKINCVICIPLRQTDTTANNMNEVSHSVPEISTGGAFWPVSGPVGTVGGIVGPMLGVNLLPVVPPVPPAPAPFAPAPITPAQAPNSQRRTSHHPPVQMHHKALSLLLATLRSPTTPNQQQEILQILKANPPLLAAFLRQRQQKREKDLVVLAADKIQQQAEQSSDIKSLQEQLKKVKSQLESVKCEKKLILASLGSSSPAAAAATALAELMDSELQCSVCAELFVGATTLNCSHTFCNYCITKWKKKKKDCPICRTAITSECKSIVIDSFIEKVVYSLTEELKKKRQEMLKAREELELELARQQSVGSSRGSISFVETDFNTDSEYIEEDEDEYTFHTPYWPDRRSFFNDSSDTDSGAEEPAGTAAGGAYGGAPTGNSPVSNNTGNLFF